MERTFKSTLFATAAGAVMLTAASAEAAFTYNETETNNPNNRCSGGTNSADLICEVAGSPLIAKFDVLQDNNLSDDDNFVLESGTTANFASEAYPFESACPTSCVNGLMGGA